LTNRAIYLKYLHELRHCATVPNKLVEACFASMSDQVGNEIYAMFVHLIICVI